MNAPEKTGRASSGWQRLCQALLLATWFGFVGGLAEAILFTTLRFIPGGLTWSMLPRNTDTPEGRQAIAELRRQLQGNGPTRFGSGRDGWGDATKSPLRHF